MRGPNKDETLKGLLPVRDCHHATAPVKNVKQFLMIF